MLYIAATTEVVSMMLVAEQPKAKQPQALKGAPVAGSRSQDLDPVKGPWGQEAFGCQIPEPTLRPEPQMGSWLLEVSSGPEDQEAFKSQIPEPTLGPTARTPPGPSPQRCPQVLGARRPSLLSPWRSIHRTHLGGFGPCSDRSTTSMRSTKMPRQDI
jgi:hypothetical protein